MAKAIQMAKRMQADEAAQVALTGDFAKPIAQIYTDLIQAGLPDTAADRVVAALAPTLWRTTQGAAHARP